MAIQERYRAFPLAANATLITQGIAVGGFIAVTSGTISIQRADNGLVILNAFPVAAGSVYSLPMLCGHYATVTLSGGASGTLLMGN